MALDRFFTPSVVVKNISKKAVRLIGQVTIKPGETIDLYRAMDVTVELFEDQILKNLERPYGDLYVEQEIKGSIQILNLSLLSFYYSIVSPSNIKAINSFAPGLVPAAVDAENFEWVSAAGITVVSPLVLTGNAISLPPADGTTDGYLSKEDWLRFNASVKGAIRIWQYQDFTAPVLTNLTLSSFENGTGLSFNASYIVDDTAAIVLVSNSSRPPTATLTFPVNLLPGNRVNVSSHIGTTVVLDQAPDISLNCRVFYLISLPATIALPNDYQEDPEFLNDSSLDYLDDLYVNQNAAESVYGSKTFEDSSIFNSAIRYSVNPIDGYFLKSDALGNASWAAVAAGGGTGDVTDAANIGIDGYGVFSSKNGSILEFKNVAPGSDNIGITSDISHVFVDTNLDAIVKNIGLDGYFYLSDDEIVTGHTTFNPSALTDPAFTITPDISVPTTNVSDGSMTIVGGILYVRDTTRGKWLSLERKFLTAGRNANVSNAYLRIDQQVPSNITGYRALRDGTITGLWAQTRANETWTFQIRRNGTVVAIASLSIIAASGNVDTAVNVDVNAGDEIQFYASGIRIGRPVVGLEIAWRI